MIAGNAYLKHVIDTIVSTLLEILPPSQLKIVYEDGTMVSTLLEILRRF